MACGKAEISGMKGCLCCVCLRPRRLHVPGCVQRPQAAACAKQQRRAGCCCGSARLTAALHVFTSQTRSGVLAAGSCRPPVYLASNAKYVDFMSSLGLAELVMDPNR